MKQTSALGKKNKRAKNVFADIADTLNWKITLPALIVLVLVIVLPKIFTIHYGHGTSMGENYDNTIFITIDIKKNTKIKRGSFVGIDFTETGTNKNLGKRVIGLPGEYIAIQKDDNGNTVTMIKANESDEYQILDEPYIVEPMNDEYVGKEWHLKEDEYFVMGDNRNNSRDSRYYGPFKKNTITDRVLLSFNKESKRIIPSIVLPEYQYDR